MQLMDAGEADVYTQNKAGWRLLGLFASNFCGCPRLRGWLRCRAVVGGAVLLAWAAPNLQLALTRDPSHPPALRPPA